MRLLALWRYYTASRSLDAAFAERDAFGRWLESCCETWLQHEQERLRGRLQHLTNERTRLGPQPCGCTPEPLRGELARLRAEQAALQAELGQRGRDRVAKP